MDNIKNKHIALLFEALSQILYNQDKINKHLDINKCDYGWGYDDSETNDLYYQCHDAANKYDDDGSCDY